MSDGVLVVTRGLGYQGRGAGKGVERGQRVAISTNVDSDAGPGEHMT